MKRTRRSELAISRSFVHAYVQRKTSPLTAHDAIKICVEEGTLALMSHSGDATATYHPVCVTVHARGFKLLNGSVPGEILIRHIWLSP